MLLASVDSFAIKELVKLVLFKNMIFFYRIAYRIALIRNKILEHKPDVFVVAGDISNYIRPEPVIAALNDRASGTCIGL